MPAPTTPPVQPVTVKTELEESKKFLQELQSQIAASRQELNQQRTQAEQARSQANIERLQKIVNDRLYGDPDDRHSQNEALLPMLEQNAASPGGKAFENYKSNYQEIVRMAMATLLVLSAYGDQLREQGAAMAYWTLHDIMEKLCSSPSVEVPLHEDVLKASRCESGGKVVFDPLSPSLFTDGVPDVMVKQVSTINEFLVRAFLISKGYEPDDDGVFTHKDSGLPLTPARFEHLKNNGVPGLKDFALKNLKGIKFSSQPMGELGVEVEKPEAIEPPPPSRSFNP